MDQVGPHASLSRNRNRVIPGAAAERQTRISAEENVSLLSPLSAPVTPVQHQLSGASHQAHRPQRPPKRPPQPRRRKSCPAGSTGNHLAAGRAPPPQQQRLLGNVVHSPPNLQEVDLYSGAGAAVRSGQRVPHSPYLITVTARQLWGLLVQTR